MLAIIEKAFGVGSYLTLSHLLKFGKCLLSIKRKGDSQKLPWKILRVTSRMQTEWRTKNYHKISLITT